LKKESRVLNALGPLGIQPALFIAYVVNFVILVFLLRIFLYRPVLNMLGQRRERIQESLAEADRVRQEAATQRAQFERELEEARQTSQEAATRVAQETEKMRDAILAEAREEADRILEQAHQQIEMDRRQAVADLRRGVVDLAVDLARRVIGETVAADEQAQRKLIQRFLEESGDQL
jgi:F-type H+-transporting ATPase subunit b